MPSATTVMVSEVDLENYDQLLSAHSAQQTHPDHNNPWDENVAFIEKTDADEDAGAVAGVSVGVGCIL